MPFPYIFPFDFEDTFQNCPVYIGEDRVPVLEGSLNIEKRIEERSTASLLLIDIAGTADYVRGMPVKIYDLDDNLIFAGFIDAPGRGELSTSGLRHDITCMDNHYLADKRLVVKAYVNQTAGYIARDLLTNYLTAEGVTEGAIQDGPVIKSATFNYTKASDCYDALKELTGFTWFIDELKKLYFIDRATYDAPWQMDNSTHRPVGQPHFNTGNSLYRNRQYIRGGKGLTDLQTEHFTGDGVLKSFTLGYPLALEPVIAEDGYVQDVGIKGLETAKDYYWSKGDATIYAEVAPAVGVDIEVQYYGQYPLITLAVHPTDAIARAAIEGGTGIVEDIVTEAQHESSEAIKESAQAKISQYCQEAERFTYQTRESGLAPGQIQAITFAPFGFTAHEMLIESISITAKGDFVLYNISCITGPSMGSWAKFFANILTRQDKTIQVGDSLLLVLLQQAETLTLSEATDHHEDDFSGGEVNRSIALPPVQGALHNVEHERLSIKETTEIDSHAKNNYKWSTTIDVGSPATDRADYLTHSITFIDTSNPANDDGTINHVEVWAHSDLKGLKVGSFYYVSGTSPNAVYECRDSVSLGDVVAGAKRTFDNFAFTIKTGDFIGCYYEDGQLDLDTSGGTGLKIATNGDEAIDPGDSTIFYNSGSYPLSLYATGGTTRCGFFTWA